MERIVATLKKPVSNVGEAAFLLGLFAFLSQFLGLARDRLLAHTFGAGTELDIYYSAFRVPDFIFVTIGSLVAVSVLIPFIASAKRESREAFELFISDVFTCFSIAIVFFCALAFVLMSLIVPKLFPGFSPDELGQIILLSRIILLSPLFLGLSNLIGSISQSYGKFVAYAMAPAIYNLGIIFGVIFLTKSLGIAGVAVGVSFGALLHLLVQMTTLTDIIPFETLCNFHKKISESFFRIKKVFLVSIPRTLSLASSNLAVFGLLSIGSVLGAGAISSFTLANNLQSVIVSIIGISFALAVFPVLSQLFNSGDNDRMKLEFVNTFRKIIFFTIPAACFIIVFRAHIVRLVLGSGAFSWEDTRLVAASLAIFALSLTFQSLYHLFMRALYAMGDNKKSFISSISGAVVMVLGAVLWQKYSLINPLPSEILGAFLKVEDVAGKAMLALPIGFVLGTIVECTALWVMVNKKIHFTKDIIKVTFHSVGASVIGAASSYVILQYTDSFFTLNKFVGLLMHATVAGISGLLIFIATLVLLENEEIYVFLKSFTRKFSGVKPLAVETDVLS